MSPTSVGLPRLQRALLSDEKAGGYALSLIAFLCAALSLVSSGYVFGVGNNIYHLPIVASLYDEPQFKTDAFIQSLRYYAAGPWEILRGSANFIDPDWLFFVLLFFSRALALAGFLWCGTLLGFTTIRSGLIFGVIVAFATPMQGLSLAGGGGLFINTFTHSEIATGLTLFVIYFMSRRSLAWAMTFNGAAFFTNAFVAVWNAVPMAVMFGALKLWDRPRLAILRQIAIGSLGFFVLAMPVIINVLENPDYGHALPVDYTVFLRQYWPLHFLFDSNSLAAKLGLLLIVVSGLVSLFSLPRTGNPFKLAFIGYILLYGIGILMPMLTHKSAILNLHLLRSSTMLHVFATLGMAALTTQWLLEAEHAERRIAGPLLALATCTNRALIILYPIVVLAHHAWASRGRGNALPPILVRYGAACRSGSLLLLVILCSWRIWEQAEINTTLRREERNWATIGSWARANTPADAEFLIPTADTRPVAKPPNSYAGDTAVFQYYSHRRVWVTFVNGAAVLWSPSYYNEWNDRIWAVLDQVSTRGRLAYAREHGIDYVIDLCKNGGDIPALYRLREICVYNTKLP